MLELPPPPPFENGESQEEPYVRGNYIFSTAPEDGPNPTDWKPTPDRPVPTWRCEHVRIDGSRCKQPGVRGTGPEASVLTEGRNTRALCKFHGGALPHVKQLASETVSAARMRLVGATDMALDTVFDLATNPKVAEAVRLKAATEILDRAGVIKTAPEIQVEVTHKTDFASEIEKKMITMQNRFKEQFDELTDEGEIVEEPEPVQEPLPEQ